MKRTPARELGVTLAALNDELGNTDAARLFEEPAEDSAYCATIPGTLTVATATDLSHPNQPQITHFV